MLEWVSVLRMMAVPVFLILGYLALRNAKRSTLVDPPKNSSSTPGDAKGPSAETVAAIARVIHYYQPIGFLAGASAEAIAMTLHNSLGPSRLDRYAGESALLDLAVLDLDKAHVWSDDPECDVAEGEGRYVSLFADLARISGGRFTPGDVQEVWESECGPIALRFSFEGVRYVVRPRYLHDWLDMQVLDQVNAVLRGKGWLFAYTGGGQVVAGVLEQDNSTLVMPLRHEELETVAMDRGICFFNSEGGEAVRVDG